MHLELDELTGSLSRFGNCLKVRATGLRRATTHRTARWSDPNGGSTDPVTHSTPSEMSRWSIWCRARQAGQVGRDRSSHPGQLRLQ